MTTTASAYLTVGKSLKMLSVDGSVNIHGVNTEAVAEARVMLLGENDDTVETFVVISFPAEITTNDIYFRGSLAEQAEALKLLAARLTIMASEIG